MARVSLRKRLQVATDTYYNHVYYSGSINVQAFREGRDRGLRGDALARFQNEKIANPPDDYGAKAVAEAHRLTARRKQRWILVSWLAATVWLVSGLYFFMATGQSLLSLYSLAFFVIGILIAKLVVGGIFHILWGITNLLQLAAIAAVEKLKTREPSQGWIRFERSAIAVLFNLAICVAEIISTFALASWAFHRAIA